MFRCFRCVFRVKAEGLFDVFFGECVYWRTGGLGVICGARDVRVNEGERGEISPPVVGFESNSYAKTAGGAT